MPKNVSGVCRYCPSPFFNKTAQSTPGTVLIGLCTELFANSLRIPYNGDRLDFTIPNNNNLLWFCAFCKDKNLLRDTPRSVMFINNVDCRRVLWDSQQIAVGFDVITGETRGKCRCDYGRNAREVYECTRPRRHQAINFARKRTNNAVRCGLYFNAR